MPILEAVQQRIRELNAAQHIDAEIATMLNAEGYQTARLHHAFTGNMVWLLRQKWDIPTVKINGKEHNPAQWRTEPIPLRALLPFWVCFQERSTSGLKEGKLIGNQLAKGMPWKVQLTQEDITRLQEWLRRARRLKKEAS